MYHVIDIIRYRRGWIDRFPDLATRGEGVMAILEPNQISEPPPIQGCIITVHKPNGTTAQLLATTSEVQHAVVGIFFSGISPDAIPRGSFIVW
jgi:hypothetical protein